LKKDNGQPVDDTAEVVVECKFWWNPLSPELVKGFRLTTFDGAGKKVDRSDPEGDTLDLAVTPTIELDASKFRPYPMVL
jgi:hypothetical protein